MKAIPLRDAHFQIEIDPAHGGVTHIGHPADPHRMNWVCAPPETGWLMRSQSWGLGYLGLNPVSHCRPDALGPGRGDSDGGE